MNHMPPERVLRVFHIGEVEVDLPVAWAGFHEIVVVAFQDAGRPLGWHASLVGADGALLLSFPWYDHADTSLGGPRPLNPATWFRGIDDFPVELPEEGWDDLEQGWWARVIPDGGLVFLAETDFDGLLDEPPARAVLDKPGSVHVGQVQVLWNCTSREAYDHAWRRAIAACRAGRPAPVADRDPETLQYVLRS